MASRWIKEGSSRDRMARADITASDGYDPLDPNGKITIRWDVMQKNSGTQDSIKKASELAQMETKGAKKERGLSPKANARVLHTALLDVIMSSNH
nr:COBRA-like protein 6 [Tanacetum cinerariifolium]